MNILSRPHRLGFVFFVVFSAPGLALAQSTWSGLGTNNNLTEPGNWVGNVAPAFTAGLEDGTNTTDLLFTNAVQTTINLSTGVRRAARNISFTGAGAGAFTFTNTGRWILTPGGSLTMDSAMTNPILIGRLGFGSNSVSGSYTLQNNAVPTTAIMSNLSCVAYMTNSNSMNIILTGSNTGLNRFDGLQQNTNAAGNSGPVSVLKTGPGTWILGGGGSPNFTGSVTISNGLLGVASDVALGTGTLNFNGGALASVSSTRTLANNININADVALGGLGQNIVLNGAVDLGGGARIITVENTGTFNGSISNGALTKAGTGTLTLGGSNYTFTGTTMISAGRLNFAIVTNGTFASTNIVINGGTLNFNFSGGQNVITNIAALNISSGLFNVADRNQTFALLNMSGGTINKGGFGVLTFSGAATNSGGAIIASGTNSDIRFNGGLTIGGATTASLVYSNTNNNSATPGVRLSNSLTYSATNAAPASFSNALAGVGMLALLGTNVTFDIGDSTNAIDMSIDWSITGSTATLRKVGGGVLALSGSNSVTNLIVDGGALTLSGANTYSGNTTVSAAGTLELRTNASLRFVIGGSGTNNAVSGTGITAMNGQFAFDLAGASTNTNATWTIVAGTLTNSYGTNFLVTGFSGVSGGNWTNTTNGVNYVFAQPTGVLSVQSTGGATPYNAWVAYWQGLDPGFTNTAGTANPDGDPFNNNMEFAFDGNPTIGTGALLTSTKVGTNAVFNYVAQTNTNAVTYQVQNTTNLSAGPWSNSVVTISNSTNQSGISQTNVYVRQEFVVPATTNNFYRVQATIAP